MGDSSRKLANGRELFGLYKAARKSRDVCFAIEVLPRGEDHV
jgi:hypothetical protein